jgi:hypothetical protein
VHSRGGDGADSIEALAKGCMKRGCACMCAPPIPTACQSRVQCRWEDARNAVSQLWMPDHAIAHARLAGISKDLIINCWPMAKILEWARTFPASMASNASTSAFIR